jgi:hypothetical protein
VLQNDTKRMASILIQDMQLNTILNDPQFLKKNLNQVQSLLQIKEKTIKNLGCNVVKAK